MSAKAFWLGLSWAACLSGCASGESGSVSPSDAPDASALDASEPIVSSDSGSDAGEADASATGTSSAPLDASTAMGTSSSPFADIDSSTQVEESSASTSSASTSSVFSESSSSDAAASTHGGESETGTTGEVSSSDVPNTTSSTEGDTSLPPPGVGPGLTDVGQFAAVDCEIASTVALAPEIPMVGIATLEIDLDGADRALIQFGSAEQYVLEAPVAWDDVDHRTLLLGMPSDVEVHYRVVVFKGDQACVGPDRSYTTGGPVAGAPTRITPIAGSSLIAPAPGFIVATRGDIAYILNKSGYVVWAHRFPATLTRATLSWDGKYLLSRDMGPFNAGSGGNIYRVDMDGEHEVRLPVSGGSHHDFTTTPEGIVYIAKEEVGACDSLYTARIDGSQSAPLVDLRIVFDKFANGPQALSPERCHVNSVRYYHDTERYSVADREKDAIAFFSKSGELLGSIGAQPVGETPNHVLAQGADSTANSPWRVQHGHHLYAPNKLVLWANGVFQGGTSRMLHYTIQGTTATLDWQYTATGTSPTLSDAQHLPNGNFLATNSANGNVHEIDPARKLVQSFNGLSRGYPVHRTTLYGPPEGM